jgi:hypothetical protein
MIGRLVKQEDGWVHEESSSQSNPHAPTTRKISSFLGLHLLVKTQAKQNLCSTLLCGGRINCF